MSERWAILVLVVVAVVGWEAVLALAEPRIWLPFAALLTTILLLAWWVGADAKARGIPGLRTGEALLLLLIAPVGLGLYLIRSRGVAVGLVSLLGFVALWGAATTSGEWRAYGP